MVISKDEVNEKTGIFFPSMFPTISVVDSNLMMSVPAKFTAYQGMDAFFHAAESVVNKNEHPMGEMFALKTIELVAKNLWFKDIITIYIRPDRHTFHFLKDQDVFTVSFYPEQYRRALQIMGSASGRDTDKVQVTGLTPVFLENGVTYREATETFMCKKIYMDQMDMNKFPKDAFRYYEEGAEPHYIIIGEVIKHQ